MSIRLFRRYWQSRVSFIWSKPTSLEPRPRSARRLVAKFVLGRLMLSLTTYEMSLRNVSTTAKTYASKSFTLDIRTELRSSKSPGGTSIELSNLALDALTGTCLIVTVRVGSLIPIAADFGHVVKYPFDYRHKQRTSTEFTPCLHFSISRKVSSN
jgi:hypothetical protein